LLFFATTVKIESNICAVKGSNHLSDPQICSSVNSDNLHNINSWGDCMASLSRFLLVACFAASVFAAPVFSASVPDAGSLLGEQRQKPAQLPDSLPKSPPTDPTSPALTDTSVQVIVKGFTFSGIDGMATAAELEELLKDAIGRKQGLADLKNLAGRVTNYLQEKGFFLARAVLPAQDVTSGIITIAVTAGRIEGDASIRTKPPVRIRATVLKKMVNEAIPAGQALENSRFERSILLMNDLPGVTAKATLERGETPGGTRVFIDATEGPLFSESLFVDNHGNRYTGALRGSTGLTANDPFGIGDQFALTAVGAADFFQGAAAYSVQLLPNGLKGGITYTGLYYQLGKELEKLDSYGYANTLGTSLSYPLLRRRALSVWSSLAYEFRMLEDYTLDTLIRERDLHVGSLDLSGNAYDNLGGGGLSNFRLAMTVGDLSLGVAANADADAATAQTEGGYHKFAYSASRLQRLVDNFAFSFSASGQISGSNLDSSEKFTLGGPNGVRAYSGGEASGDSGHIFSAELRYDVPYKSDWGAVQMVTFVDSGNTTLHDSVWENSINTATEENNYWLSGWGLGFNLGKPGTYGLRFAWAHTIDDNPGRSVAGFDADNKQTDNRFWLRAMFWF
jgi:hemolysin activation/secretion protein